MNAQDNVLATGFAFTEGPCIAPDGTLYVTELANRCVSRVVAGNREVFAELGGSPNGAAFAADGSLYVANGAGNWGANASTQGPGLGGGQASIQRVQPSGDVETVLTAIDGVPLNSPNDIVGDSHGGFYFTDPSWPPLDENNERDVSRVQPGSVCYLAADGSAVRLHSSFIFPNGIVISDDGTSLFVDETGTGLIHRFPISEPGVVGEPEEYVDLGGMAAGPDGMAFDSAGRLLVAGHNAQRVFVVAAGGGSVERELWFEDPEVSNICFGGEDFRTVFVTQASLGRVVTLKWPVPGMRLHPDRTRVVQE